MKIKKITAILLAALAVTAFSGCDSTMKAEHEKFSKKPKEEWYEAKQGIMYEVAVQEYKVGDLDKCRDSLKSALESSAPTPAILTLAAKVDMEQGGNLERAADYLKKALAVDAAKKINDPEPCYLLGVVYQRWQKLDTACDYYQQAVAKKPSEAVYVLATAEMLIALGRLDDAKDFLETKKAFFEQSAALHIALARIALLQNDYGTATHEYRDATLYAPEDKSVRWSYAGALYDAGKYNDAAKILEELRKDPITTPKASPTSTTSVADHKLDEDAAKANRATLLMMLGESYISLNRPLDARDCFQEIIRTQPDNMNACLSLGKAYLMTGDLPMTINAAKRVLRSDPKNVQAMILAAAAQQKQKKWSDALDTLADAGRLSPKDATVLCMQGLSELQLGKKELAIAYFEKAVAASPTDAWANDLLLQVKPPEPVKLVTPPEAPQGATALPSPITTPVVVFAASPENQAAADSQALVPASAAAANVIMIGTEEVGPVTGVTNGTPTANADAGGQ